MKNLILTLMLALFTMTSASAQNDVMDNNAVITLLKEGFTAEEIIGAIETSSTRTIKYSIDFMRELKAAGATPELTTYIQKIAKTDFGYEGIYWWNTGDKPKKMLRSQFEKEEKGFNLGTLAAAAVVGVAVGSAVSGHAPSSGVAAATGAGAVLLSSTGKEIKKLCIMGQTSRTPITTRRPTFRFYLPKHETMSFSKEANNWYEFVMNDIQSPNEFQVVKMKAKKNRRVFTDNASYSIAGFTGTNNKDRVVIDFQVNEINNNTFEVTFNEDIEPGEYVFFWKNGLGNEVFRQYVFGFDFTIQ